MLFGNISRTKYDLSFSLGRIPVRVHPLFWLISALLGASLSPRLLVIWIAVVFVSILFHELGHAVAIRQFHWRPSIVLYTFGGLASYQPTHHDPRKQMFISLAGPAAGFLLAGALIGVLQATGHRVLVAFGRPYGLDVVAIDIQNVNLFYLANFLLEVNIWWGLMNLLPVFPLDGGQFLQELFDWLRVPDGVVKSLWVSIGTAAAVALYALVSVHDYYLAAMFGFLTYTSYQTLQAHLGRGGGYGGW